MRQLLAALIVALAAPAWADGVKPGATFADCANCPQMVVVPPGSYLMGSPPNAAGTNPDEVPQHSVAIAAFAIGKTEVTQEQWHEIMGTYPSFNRGRTLPIETISWDEVQTFIAKLGAKTGKPYRLPSEAEWEYAARAGTTTAYFFGDDPAEIGRYAWFNGNSGSKAHPVGEKQPNAFGLYDMHGNVWEWVQDCYKPSYAGAPMDGSPAPETAGCAHVIRDGSGVDFPKSLRVAERYSNRSDYRNGNLGFRLARSLP